MSSREGCARNSKKVQSLNSMESLGHAERAAVAAIQPGNLRFGGGEALSHDAQSDALRLSEKSEKSGRDHLPSESLPGLHSGAAHAARSLRKSFGTCLPPFEFRPLTCFVSALPRQPIKGSCPSRECGFLRPTIEWRTLFFLIASCVWHSAAAHFLPARRLFFLPCGLVSR